MTRPWRLTRRQRVEMEAALSGIRGEPHYLGHAFSGAWLLGLPRTAQEFERGLDPARATRTFRARVAIALRAALRADEDARCEEASRRAIVTEGVAGRRGLEVSVCVGVWALAEWPLMYAPGRVPLALWERVDFSPAIAPTSATSQK